MNDSTIALPGGYVGLQRLRLSCRRLKDAILKRRKSIRWHRDQEQDDRCWLDDFVPWAFLKGTPRPPRRLPSFRRMMEKCTAFFTFRNAKKRDPIPEGAIRHHSKWDADLELMGPEQLLTELYRIQLAIGAHAFIKGRPRDIEADRYLYLVLPEKLTADFRLPSRRNFLGEGRAPKAGCPPFWRSHLKCRECIKVCNIHEWGPCT